MSASPHFSRPLLFVVAIASLITTATLISTTKESGRWERTWPFLVPFVVISIALMLAAWCQERFWWTMRVVSFIIASTFLVYLIYELAFSNDPFVITARHSDSTPFNAMLGFLFYSVPCFLYAFRGNIWWKAKNEGQVDARDRRALRIALLAHRAFMFATTGAAVIAIVRALS